MHFYLPAYWRCLESADGAIIQLIGFYFRSVKSNMLTNLAVSAFQQPNKLSIVFELSFCCHCVRLERWWVLQ